MFSGIDETRFVAGWRFHGTIRCALLTEESCRPAVARAGGIRSPPGCGLSLHLHFNRPAKIGIAERELLEPVSANGGEGAEVRVARAVEQAHEERSQPVTASLVRWERVAVPLAQLARAYNQIGLGALDWLEQLREVARG
jgi:hypothetical protein